MCNEELASILFKQCKKTGLTFRGANGKIYNTKDLALIALGIKTF